MEGRVQDIQRPRQAKGCEVTRRRCWEVHRMDIAVMLLGFESIDGLLGFAESVLSKVNDYDLWQVEILSAMIGERQLQIETNLK